VKFVNGVMLLWLFWLLACLQAIMPRQVSNSKDTLFIFGARPTSQKANNNTNTNTNTNKSS
jgi:hypothetical protein